MAELAPHLTTAQAFLMALRRQNVRLPVTIDPTEPAGVIDADGRDVYAAPAHVAAEAQVRVKAECQYAKDVSMPEHRCAVRCQYEQKVLVKPLEWQEQENSSGETSYWGHHQFGCYAIDRDYFSVVPWELVSGGCVMGNFDTVEQAKAAAQSDYDQRIRSALASETEGD